MPSKQVREARVEPPSTPLKKKKENTSSNNIQSGSRRMHTHRSSGSESSLQESDCLKFGAFENNGQKKMKNKEVDAFSPFEMSITAGNFSTNFDSNVFNSNSRERKHSSRIDAGFGTFAEFPKEETKLPAPLPEDDGLDDSGNFLTPTFRSRKSLASARESSSRRRGRSEEQLNNARSSTGSHRSRSKSKSHQSRSKSHTRKATRSARGKTGEKKDEGTHKKTSKSAGRRTSSSSHLMSPEKERRNTAYKSRSRGEGVSSSDGGSNIDHEKQRGRKSNDATRESRTRGSSKSRRSHSESRRKGSSSRRKEYRERRTPSNSSLDNADDKDGVEPKNESRGRLMKESGSDDRVRSASKKRRGKNRSRRHRSSSDDLKTPQTPRVKLSGGESQSKEAATGSGPRHHSRRPSNVDQLLEEELVNFLSPERRRPTRGISKGNLEADADFMVTPESKSSPSTSGRIMPPRRTASNRSRGLSGMVLPDHEDIEGDHSKRRNGPGRGSMRASRRSLMKEEVFGSPRLQQGTRLTHSTHHNGPGIVPDAQCRAGVSSMHHRSPGTLATGVLAAHSFNAKSPSNTQAQLTRAAPGTRTAPAPSFSDSSAHPRRDFNPGLDGLLQKLRDPSDRKLKVEKQDCKGDDDDDETAQGIPADQRGVFTRIAPMRHRSFHGDQDK